VRNGKRILALDASTTAVGWCVADDTQYVDSGVFVPSRSMEWHERVAAFSNWLGNLLIADQEIKIVVYELATGNRRNMRTNLKLGAVEYAARCAVRDACGQRRFETVTASQVKATGVNKDALWAANAIKNAPLDDKYPGDEADSLGVWQAWLRKVGYQCREN